MATGTRKKQFFNDDVNPHEQYKPAESLFKLISGNFFRQYNPE